MNSIVNRDVPNSFSLPKRINRLGKFAYNLWWAWNPEAQQLFRQIDMRLWDESATIRWLFSGKWTAAKSMPSVMIGITWTCMTKSCKNMMQYMQDENTWFGKRAP